MIPQLSSDLCQNIFGDSVNTISGYTPDGFIIKHKLLPAPAIFITPLKIVVIAINKAELFKYIATIKQVLPKYEFSAYGLNADFEWLNLGCFADNWMCEKFLKEDFNSHKCNKLGLVHTINTNEYLNINFEQRNGIKDGLFASLNHHYGYNRVGFPDEKELIDLFLYSEKIQQHELSILLEENNE